MHLLLCRTPRRAVSRREEQLHRPQTQRKASLPSSCQSVLSVGRGAAAGAEARDLMFCMSLHSTRRRIAWPMAADGNKRARICRPLLTSTCQKAGLSLSGRQAYLDRCIAFCPSHGCYAACGNAINHLWVVVVQAATGEITVPPTRWPTRAAR